MGVKVWRRGGGGGAGLGLGRAVPVDAGRIWTLASLYAADVAERRSLNWRVSIPAGSETDAPGASVKMRPVISRVRTVSRMRRESEKREVVHLSKQWGATISFENQSKETTWKRFDFRDGK